MLAREAAGMTIDWPTDARIETAEHEHEYPADIWAEAKDRLDALPVAEQQRLRRAAQDGLAQLASTSVSYFRTEIFNRSFGILDIVFVGLAILTAFRLGMAGGE